MLCDICGKETGSEFNFCSINCMNSFSLIDITLEYNTIYKKEEYIILLKNNLRRYITEKYIAKQNPAIYKDIILYNLNNFKSKLENTKGRKHFSQMLSNYIFDLTKSPKCIICSENVLYNQFNFEHKGYNLTCGIKCANKLAQVTINKNCINKFGVNHHTQKPTYKGSFRNKIETKLRSRLKDYEIININYDKYEVDFKCNICNKINENVDIRFVYNRLNPRRNINPCEHCVSKTETTSKGENDLHNYILSLGLNTLKNKCLLGGNKEIDIYLPDLKIGIEYNGIYWHNVNIRGKTYHYDKSTLAYSKGIKLIHVWEDDWHFKQDIIKSRILNITNKNIIRIYGRKCYIKEISAEESFKFLNENHIQGNYNSRIKLGLFYNEELVSVMTFSGLRNGDIEGHYELTRFCNKLGISVVGGASKLLKYFEDVYRPISIISYADRDWTFDYKDSVYEKLGFEYVGDTGLDYWWCIDGVRYNRMRFQHHKLVKEGYDSSKTESEIMEERGYDRVYGTGNLKLEKRYNRV